MWTVTFTESSGRQRDFTWQKGKYLKAEYQRSFKKKSFTSLCCLLFSLLPLLLNFVPFLYWGICNFFCSLVSRWPCWDFHLPPQTVKVCPKVRQIHSSAIYKENFFHLAIIHIYLFAYHYWSSYHHAYKGSL